MARFLVCWVSLSLVFAAGLAFAEEPAKGKDSAAAKKEPLPPIEAIEMIGERIVVRMTVRSAKDRLEKHGEIYLDSEDDFKSEKNFAVVINRKGAAELKERKITDIVGHFRNKTIEAEGVVKVVGNIPRIEIEEAKYLQLVANPGVR